MIRLMRPLLAALALFALGTGGAQAQAPKAALLNPQDLASVQKAETYLNAIGTLSARFLQVAPDGSYAEGKVYLSRPGKLRLDYAPPTPIEVVADGRWLIYHDKELKQVSYVGLNETPAGILVRPDLDFEGRDLMVTRVTRQPGVVNITAVQSKEPGAGSITLVFTEEPWELKQWKIKDPQGQITTVSLFDTRTGDALPKTLFDFKDPYFKPKHLEQ